MAVRLRAKQSGESLDSVLSLRAADQRIAVTSLRLTATGLPALTAGPAIWMRAVVSVAGVLRAVMPTSSTAMEATSEIATIFTWVVRSAVKIVELFITAIFRGSSKHGVLSM